MPENNRHGISGGEWNRLPQSIRDGVEDGSLRRNERGNYETTGRRKKPGVGYWIAAIGVGALLTFGGVKCVQSYEATHGKGNSLGCQTMGIAC